ncbi:MAG: UDP-glucose/GDP-mannose dehydrogenase family protein [Pseudomonadota bacterium]
MKIVVIGTGYVGLVAGTCLADMGHEVVCIDNDPQKCKLLDRGEVPFFEPGLAEKIAANRASGALAFRESLHNEDKAAHIFIIAVGTPPGENGEPDMRYIHSAISDISSYVGPDQGVITKSTVPIGTGDKIAALFKETHGVNSPIVMSNPEFLREGTAVTDFMVPDRVAIGLPDDDPALWEKGKAMAELLYKPLLHKSVPILFSSRVTAEITKYAANTFLATKVAFINEIADICESTGADIREVSTGIGLDERIGSRFLRAGPGFGGSCFPKDTEALAAIARQAGAATMITEAVITSNSGRKRAMGLRIVNALNEPSKGKTVALLGLTFKPNTDDMRASPALDLIDVLEQAGVNIVAYDPEGMENCKQMRPDIIYAKNIEDCVHDADAAVVVTEWGQFQTINLEWLNNTMRGNVLVDLRNVFDARKAKFAGLRYVGIGQGTSEVS